MRIRSLQATRAPAAVIIIRIAVGAVFLSEGIQKLLFPDDVGAGRFARIGLTAPDLIAPLVASFEILCGALLLAGALTRLAAVPILVIMCVAIAMTKLPILVDEGFWRMAHESRTDFAMLMGALFLLIVGAGPWSVDGRVTKYDMRLET